MTEIRDKLNHVLYLEQLKSDESVDTRMYIVYDYEYKEYRLHYTRRAKDNNMTNTDEDYEIKFYKNSAFVSWNASAAYDLLKNKKLMRRL